VDDGSRCALAIMSDYSPSRRGSHSEICGRYVTSISTANITP
jgi:hypothetical protein